MNRVSTQPLRIAALAALIFAFITATSAQTKAPAAAKAAPAKSAAADPDLALAKKAALDWLALVDAGKFEGSWDEAATSLQKGQKKADWSAGLGGSRATMGRVMTRTFLNSEIRTNLPNLPPDKYITVRFTTAFEKHKDGAESVTLVKDGTRGLRTMSYFLK